MVDQLLNRSVARQFDAFSRGFRILCDGPATRLFNSQVWHILAGTLKSPCHLRQLPQMMLPALLHTILTSLGASPTDLLGSYVCVGGLR